MGSSLTPVSTPQLSSIDEGSRPVSVRGKRSAIQTQPSTYAARDNRRKSLRARPAAEETEETEAVEDPTTGTDTNDVPKDDELTPVPPTSPLSVESEEEVEEEEEKEEEKHTIEAKRPRRADGKGKQTGSPTAEASLSNVGTSPVKKGKEKAGRGGAVGLAPKLDNFESLLEPRLLGTSCLNRHSLFQADEQSGLEVRGIEIIHSSCEVGCLLFSRRISLLPRGDHRCQSSPKSYPSQSSE